MNSQERRRERFKRPIKRNKMTGNQISFRDTILEVTTILPNEHYQIKYKTPGYILFK